MSHHYDRTGERIEDDDPPNPAPASPPCAQANNKTRASATDLAPHDPRCSHGWLGENQAGLPVPCLDCRPHLRVRASLAQTVKAFGDGYPDDHPRSVASRGFLEAAEAIAEANPATDSELHELCVAWAAIVMQRIRQTIQGLDR